MIKMVILDQSKPILLILKNIISKIKNLCTTSLLFIKMEIRQLYNPFKIEFYIIYLNIFFEMKGKKVIHWGGAWGKWGNRPNFVLEV